MTKLQLTQLADAILTESLSANENTKKFRHEDAIYTAYLTATLVLSALSKSILAVRDAE